MLAVSLVFGSFLTVLFLVVGLIGGWVAREYMMNYREVPRPHPEMFDNQGNLIPDEVIAFNFENYYDDNEENHDDEGLKNLLLQQNLGKLHLWSCLRTLLLLKFSTLLVSNVQRAKKVENKKT